MALAPQQFCVRWNSYHTNLQAVFPRLLSTEHFADVTLACESRQLRCHKLVLSACSAYFERLLVHNPCKHPIVFMKDMRFSEMQALVDFMYKGEVNVTQDELPSLLKSAEALQIRGLCSGDTSGMASDVSAGTKQNDVTKDYTVATEALLAQAQRDVGVASTAASSTPSKTANGTVTKKRKSEERENSARSGNGTVAANSDVKEETVEEDGLYYGELDHDNMEFNEDDESGKPGSSLSQPSARSQYIRVKPESELFFTDKQQNISKTDADYITKLSKMNTAELQNEFRKYGFSTAHLEEFYSKMNLLKNPAQPTENDYYKSWLEQNGELEVSLLKASDKKRSKLPEQLMNQSEVELIPKNPKTSESNSNLKLPEVKNQLRRRGRPPIFKDRNIDIGDTVLKSDLDQFLEGKEVSSSGLSRKDLERVMMGKFNPNRRYSNEAMWAALMDVKKGGSIYRAAQTHKVPRKSLRNWMKRCHIKSSFPMPQQLKQFVENSKKQKEYKAYDVQNMAYDSGNFESKSLEVGTAEEFGKHFLFNSSNTVSSDDEVRKVDAEPTFLDNDGKTENAVSNEDNSFNPSVQE